MKLENLLRGKYKRDVVAHSGPLFCRSTLYRRRGWGPWRLWRRSRRRWRSRSWSSIGKIESRFLQADLFCCDCILIRSRAISKVTGSDFVISMWDRSHPRRLNSRPESPLSQGTTCKQATTGWFPYFIMCACWCITCSRSRIHLSKAVNDGSLSKHVEVFFRYARADRPPLTGSACDWCKATWCFAQKYEYFNW